MKRKLLKVYVFITGTNGKCKKEGKLSIKTLFFLKAPQLLFSILVNVLCLGEEPSKFVEYILAVVAGIVLLFIIASIVSFILYKKSLRYEYIKYWLQSSLKA